MNWAPKHEHKINAIFYFSDLSWAEKCSVCNRRRIVRMGCGRDTSTHYSRWCDVDDVEIIKRLFPDIFGLDRSDYKNTVKTFLELKKEAMP
jgi:hypothetical protein